LYECVSWCTRQTPWIGNRKIIFFVVSLFLFMYSLFYELFLENPVNLENTCNSISNLNKWHILIVLILKIHAIQFLTSTNVTYLKDIGAELNRKITNSLFWSISWLKRISLLSQTFTWYFLFQKLNLACNHHVIPSQLKCKKSR